MHQFLLIPLLCRPLTSPPVLAAEHSDRLVASSSCAIDHNPPRSDIMEATSKLTTSWPLRSRRRSARRLIRDDDVPTNYGRRTTCGAADGWHHGAAAAAPIMVVQGLFGDPCRSRPRLPNGI